MSHPEKETAIIKIHPSSCSGIHLNVTPCCFLTVSSVINFISCQRASNSNWNHRLHWKGMRWDYRRWWVTQTEDGSQSVPGSDPPDAVPFKHSKHAPQRWAWYGFKHQRMLHPYCLCARFGLCIFVCLITCVYIFASAARNVCPDEHMLFCVWDPKQEGEFPQRE